MQQLLLATDNPGKIAELRALLAPITCIAQSDLHIPSIAESGLSFIENAILKARHASAHAALPALADDSGLVVPALNGRPGIYSARFAGSHANDTENMQQLLAELAPITARQAYFYCALALLQHHTDPTPLIAIGRLDGVIHTHGVGQQGFGYDPIFFLPTYQLTLAELPLAIKNRISHRAMALQQLKKTLY